MASEREASFAEAHAATYLISCSQSGVCGTLDPLVGMQKSNALEMAYKIGLRLQNCELAAGHITFATA